VAAKIAVSKTSMCRNTPEIKEFGGLKRILERFNLLFVF
jgi:hypothetical protein